MSRINTAKKTFTSEQSDTLAYWAIMVSTVAAERQPCSSSAYVDWDVIHDIRKTLEAAGIDWRGACRRHKAAVKAERQAYMDARYPREDKAP